MPKAHHEAEIKAKCAIEIKMLAKNEQVGMPGSEQVYQFHIISTAFAAYSFRRAEFTDFHQLQLTAIIKRHTYQAFLLRLKLD